MNSFMKKLLCGVAVSLCASAVQAQPEKFAPQAATENVQTLSPVIVTAAPEGSLTSPNIEQSRATVQRTPGAVTVVDADDFKDRYALSIKDMLKDTAGVYAQQRINEESRVSIRGSGVSRGFHLRGLTLLQDGVPLNLPDGGGDFYELDPLTFRYVEVYKGANGLRYGANSLGGAINFVTTTARTADSPLTFSSEGGSFGTTRSHLEGGDVFGAADAYGSVTVSAAQGYRDHSGSHSTRLTANTGYQFTPHVETRFYLTYNNIDQLLPGTITLAQAMNTPQKADPGSVAGNQARNTDSWRLVNKTTARWGDTTLEAGAYFFNKKLYHPIFQVLDENGDFYGLFAQISEGYDKKSAGARYTLGLRADAGVNDAKRFVNVGGSEGAPTQAADQRASNVTLYGEYQWPLMSSLALVTGGQFIHAERAVDVRMTTTGNRSDRRDYDHFSPKLGLLWDVMEHAQVYSNISQSYEVPTFTELVQGGSAQFVPVSAQQAWTLELGTRGEQGIWSWDASIYRAWVRDEMMQFTPAAGMPAATFNAGHTVHQGVELSAQWRVAENLLSKGDRLQWKQTYLFSDFRFDGDPTYGNNRIAGIPRHYLTTELRYTHPLGFFVAPNVEWSPEASDVDFANTLQAPVFALINLGAGYEWNNRYSLFVEGRNLADRRYVSTYSTLATATPANSNVFYPGDGRAVYAGVRLKW